MSVAQRVVASIVLLGAAGCDRGASSQPRTEPAPKPVSVAAAPKPVATPASTRGDARDAAAPRHGSLRDVDWKNFEYLPGLVSLKDGSGEMREYEEAGGLHDTTQWRFVAVAYGDLDASPGDEAAVLIDEQWYGPHGGQSRRQTVYPFRMVDGRPKLMATPFDVTGPQLRIAGGSVEIRGDAGCTAFALDGERWQRRDGCAP